MTASLKCIRCQDRLHGVRNYNPAIITGFTNLWTSCFKDHARSDMQQGALVLFRKSQCSDATEYTPIAKALSSLDASSEQRLKKKVQDRLPAWLSQKMAPICELEEKHGVDLAIYDDLLRIAVDAPHRLCQWCHSALVEGQPTQTSDTRASPKPTTSQSEDDTTTSEPYHFSL